MTKKTKRNGGRSVAVIDGVRTPFCKRGTELRDLGALDLGALCVAELWHRHALDGGLIDKVVFGQVIPSLEAPNIAREIVLRGGLDTRTDACTVSSACITSYRSVVDAAHAIRCGDIDVAIAGGADSASQVPVQISNGLVAAVDEARSADSVREGIQVLASVELGDFVPQAPALAEISTGLTMGESAEWMAKVRDISRAAQDDFAHRSHQRAARAWEQGHFDREVMQVFVPPEYAPVDKDNLVRDNSERDAYAQLRPAFDTEHGTLTAGNASPLSDGAAAVLLMSGEKAAELGHTPLGFIRSHAFAAVDPRDELLIGPVDAIPVALDRAGMSLADIDLVDLHEAFAAQTLAVLQELERRDVGVIADDALNVGGGSIALGHPFAATGARQITQTLHELRRRDQQTALCSACAAGGLAAALVLEAA